MNLGSTYTSLFFVQGDEAQQYLDGLDQSNLADWLDEMSDYFPEMDGETSTEMPWGNNDTLEGSTASVFDAGVVYVHSNRSLPYLSITLHTIEEE